MAVIRMLDQETINQIAAGEVIERPASIVKELVENSIDAGASQIQVEIREGGISYIRVTDNGMGIAPDQIRLAFLRHSTSKIRGAEDLSRIDSLGFRGEALASIAAVARVEVLTKTPSALTGIRYVIEGGEEKRFEEIACPVGTTFRVENLFFNTPVRKKFLKKETMEASQVNDYIQRMVMGHPEISFRFIRNGKEPSIHSPGNNQLKNSVFAVYGRDVLSQLLEVQAEENGIVIDGFISRPQQNRASRSYENYYLNGRYIKSRIIERAIDDAYKDYVIPGTFPIVILKIKMDPSELDVNVHPTKMEVRFTKEQEVSEAVFHALLNTLKQEDLTARMAGQAKPEAAPAAQAPQPVPFGAVSVSQPEEPPRPKVVYEQQDMLPEPRTKVSEPAPAPYDSVEPVEQTPAPAAENRSPIRQLPEHMTVIGQAFRTYWIVEGEGVLYMIDQHAAHERVLYDRLKERLSTGSLDSQMLLEPCIFQLPPSDYALVMDHQNVFERLGYSVEPFGENTVLVREVPYIFNGPLSQEDFQTMVDCLSEGMRRVDVSVLIDRMAMISCKAAIKGNDAISLAEFKSLLDQLIHSPNPFNCPHGRPTMLTMSRQEVEHRFKRS